LSAESVQSPIATRLLAFSCFLESSWRLCSNVCKWTVIHPPDARTSHLRTLSKIVGKGLSACPFWSAPKRLTEPHIIHAFPGTSTPREEIFSFPSGWAGEAPSPARPRIVHAVIVFGKGVSDLTRNGVVSDLRHTLSGAPHACECQRFDVPVVACRLRQRG
jgi:hypothetical protein